MSNLAQRNENVNSEPPPIEAQPKFNFADLPLELQQELRKPTSPRCLIRADLVRALTWKKSRQRYTEAAIVLSQLIYLPTHNEGKGPDGEYAINFDDLEAYTGLSLYALTSAYQYLIEIGAISDVRHHPKWPRFRVNWEKVIELMEIGKSTREERTCRLEAKAQKRKAAAIARSAICHGTAFSDMSRNRVQRYVAAYLNNQEEPKKNLSPTERKNCAHAPENEGKEGIVPEVNATATLNGKAEGSKRENVSDEEFVSLVRLFHKEAIRDNVSEAQCRQEGGFLRSLLKEHTFADLKAVVEWVSEHKGGEVRTIYFLKTAFDQALLAVAEAKEEAARVEARRQAQAECLAQDEARRVQEAEDYARQQREIRQPVQSEARSIHPVGDSQEKADEAYRQEQRQWNSHFLTWMRERGGGEARNASVEDEMEFRRLYPPPKRPERRAEVSIGEGMAAVMANLHLKWPAAGVSA